jgi:hypothetical protein
MFCSPQATWKTGLSVSLENTSQKMFIGNDKISKTVNDSDSDGGNCSEISDDTLKGQSQCLCGPRRRSKAARLLQSWVQIPPGIWMLVCCVFVVT